MRIRMFIALFGAALIVTASAMAVATHPTSGDTASRFPSSYRFKYADSVEADVVPLRLPRGSNLTGVRIVLGGRLGSRVRVSVLRASHYDLAPFDVEELGPSRIVTKRISGPEPVDVMFEEPLSPLHGWCYVRVERMTGNSGLLTDTTSRGSLCLPSIGESYERQLIETEDGWRSASCEYGVEPILAMRDPDGSAAWVVDTVESTTRFIVGSDSRYSNNAVLVRDDQGASWLLCGNERFGLDVEPTDTALSTEELVTRDDALLIPIPGVEPLYVELPIQESVAHVRSSSGGFPGEISSTLSVPTFRRVRSVAVGDVNNDGLEDVLIIGETGNGTSVPTILWQRKDNTFIAGSPIGVVPEDVSFVNVGDMNADGRIDVIWTRAIGSQYYTSTQLPDGNWKIDSVGKGLSEAVAQRPSYFPSKHRVPGVQCGYQSERMSQDARSWLGNVRLSNASKELLPRTSSHVLFVGFAIDGETHCVVSGCPCRPSVVLEVTETACRDATGQQGVAARTFAEEAMVVRSANNQVGVVGLGPGGITLSTMPSNVAAQQVYLQRHGTINGTHVRFHRENTWYETIVSQSFGGLCQDASASLPGIDRVNSDSVIIVWPGETPRRELFVADGTRGLPENLTYGTGQVYTEPRNLTVSVVPNPVTDRALVTVTGPAFLEVSLLIVSVEGRLIRSSSHTTNAVGVATVQLQVGDSGNEGAIAPGSYLIMADGPGCNATTKFLATPR
ncbi:MAG: VCBS repeat-containing protein [Ignavibacteria bacterium]|nr:VCBS repeat-containing protein [Ignavibacteria bacterium]